MSFLYFLMSKMVENRGSFEVTKAMVDQFSANVMHLSQQKYSRIRPFCRLESQNAETAFYDRIGKRTARRKEGRHADVVYTDTPHSRRAVSLEDNYDADLVDKEDKIRTIMNLDNEYAMAISFALGRKFDEIIIDAATGDAYTGKNGTTAVSVPDSQKVVPINDAGNAHAGLNVRALRQTRKIFKQNEAIMDGEKLILVHAAQQADDLLGNTEVTSSDFNTIKTLVNGEVDTFMGFKFVETELLNFTGEDITDADFSNGTIGSGSDTISAGDARICFAMTESRGLLFALGQDMQGRIDEIPGKHYAHQIYASHSAGAVRMEEEQVVLIYALES